MKAKEKIEVYINIDKGKTVCICKRNKKRCNKACEPDVVERDRFAEWEDTFRTNRFGR